uniref:hypothetical protein n=1 Tax=Enterococcus faecalis TaxID=1351 RepID=UPI00041E362A|nr:hypothetical protein [Enterococcus faecalis]
MSKRITTIEALEKEKEESKQLIRKAVPALVVRLLILGLCTSVYLIFYFVVWGIATYCLQEKLKRAEQKIKAQMDDLIF